MANSPLLQIPLLSVSQTAKEETINTMVSYLERSMNDAKTLAFASGNLTLPEVDLQRYFMFKTTGVGASSILTVSAIKRMFVIDNLASGNALTVSCTTDTVNVPAGAICTLYCDGSTLISVTDSTVMGGGGGVTNFLGLSDTPNVYTGTPKFVLRVKNDLTGIEFHAQAIADMADVNLTGLADGYILQWDAATSKFKAVALSTGGGADYWKDAVDCATTGPIDLADVIVGYSIDSVTLTSTSSMLIKDQVDKTENGIYYFVGGTLTRRPDANDPADLRMGMAVSVAAGGINAYSIWFLTDDIPGIGADIEFASYVPVVTLMSLDDVDDSVPPTNNQVLTWDSTLNGAKFKAPQAVYPTLTGNAGKVLTVNAGATDVVWQSAGASSYPSMTGNEGKVLAVDGTGTDVEWIELPDPPSNEFILAMFFAGTLATSELLMRYVTKTAFDLTSFTDSIASAVTASTGTTALTLLKNGVSFGTITFTTSATGVFSGAGTTFAVDDILTVTAAATVDATLANVSVTLKGIKP